MTFDVWVAIRMTSFFEVLLPVTCLALVRASGLDVGGRYDNNGLMIQDLYKHLANLDPSYFIQRDDDVSDEAGRDSWQETDQRAPVSRGQADIRDSEYIGHSSNAGSQGFMYMSGKFSTRSSH